MGLHRVRWDTYKSEGNTNPFEGAVDEGIFVGDAHGNIIYVSQGHQVGGSKDGECIQVKDKEGIQTGTRKDGKGHPQTHEDPRAQEPHAHVPGVTNPDGTPWLPIH